jgi:hypothetical protein
LAFPENGHVTGNVKYYFAYGDGVLDSSLHNDNNLPTQSVKLFLKKYPKVMWVSNYSEFMDKVKRVVFMEKKGKYLAWLGGETIEGAECVTNVATWPYAKDIEEPKEYTMQEIADALKIDVNDLKIKK